MTMNACKINVFAIYHGFYCFYRNAVRNRKTELAVHSGGLNEVVSMCVYAGINSHKRVYSFPERCAKLVEQADFVEAVDYDGMYSALYRKLEFKGRFIVSVKINTFRRQPCRQRGRQLAARHDVGADAFLSANLVYRFGRKRLGRITNQAVAVVALKNFLITSDDASYISLVHNVKRRTEARGQFRRVATAYFEMPRFVDF